LPFITLIVTYADGQMLLMPPRCYADAAMPAYALDDADAAESFSFAPLRYDAAILSFI